MMVTKVPPVEAGDVDRLRTSVLDAVFPDGVPDSERLLAATMPPDRLRQAERRLAALLAAERRMAEASTPPGGTRSLNDLADAAGMGRTAFFELRRRWSDVRSLASLVPVQVRPPRGRDRRPQFDEAAALAVDVVAAAPIYVSTSAMARQLMARLNAPISTQTAIRMIRDARRICAADLAYLKANFAAMTLVDVSATALTVEREGGYEYLLICVVMDRASRLVVGHASGFADEAIGLQRTATENAHRRVLLFGPDRPGPGPTQIEYVVGPGPEPEVREIAHSLWDQLGRQAVIATGPRRFGERLVSQLGPRVDRIRLLPRSTAQGRSAASGSTAHLTFTHAPDAKAVLDLAVDRHNALVIRRLSDAGFATRAEADPVGGSLSSALGRLCASLS